jgi:hypothetical protein
MGGRALVAAFGAVAQIFIRVHEPERLATLLLAEDKGSSEQQVRDLLARGNSSGVALTPGPSHLFHRRLRWLGKLRTYDDVYGIDKKMAAALFGRAEARSAGTPPEPRPQKQGAWNSGGALDAIPGLFGN